jgi:APA family basic amino acid/polyamine antiporter
MSDPIGKTDTATPRRQLSLFDVVCIIVGIIIGSGIYRSTPFIAQNVSGPWWLMFAWTFGGLIALVGALCYAELTTTYPAEGGDYVFLSKAYGRRMGFLFTWTEFWIVRPGNVGAVAYVFAEYARELVPLGSDFDLGIYAGGAIVLVTGLNVLGVRVGKWTQNVLTALKVLGLVVIFVVAFLLVSPPDAEQSVPREGPTDFRLAIVLVLFAYGGWKDMCYVAAEVRHPEKNLLRGLVFGTAAVMAIYLLINLAFIRGLGFQGFRDSKAVAADLLEIPWGETGSRAISLLICVSCLGAMNGMIFTGARIYYAMGTEHRLYAWLGEWNEWLGTPIRSLLLQGGVTLVLVSAFAADPASFERLVVLTGPFFWAFMVLVGVALFILRSTDPTAKRTYHVLFYPFTPLLFCATSAYMTYSSFTYLLSKSQTDAFLGLCVVGLGLAISFLGPPEPARHERLAKPGKAGNASRG